MILVKSAELSPGTENPGRLRTFDLWFYRLPGKGIRDGRICAVPWIFIKVPEQKEKFIEKFPDFTNL